jgi:hypothetical protein
VGRIDNVVATTFLVLRVTYLYELLDAPCLRMRRRIVLVHRHIESDSVGCGCGWQMEQEFWKGSIACANKATSQN